jgi:hypothetical protein
VPPGVNGTYSAPSVTRDGNLIVLAADGPSHSLDFYWQTNGDPTGNWHQETVAATGAAYSAPSIAVDGNQIIIVVEDRTAASCSSGRPRGTRSGT